MKKKFRLSLRQLLPAVKLQSGLAVKLLFSLAAMLLVGLAAALFFCSHKKDEKQFSHITSELFAEEMTASTLNMHYTLANPADFGIGRYEPVLPVYSRASTLQNQAAAENTHSALQALHSEKLSPRDSYTRKLLLRSLENSLNAAEFPYYDEPLSPSSGMQSQLPILLAEYTFRSRRDVEDYLALLNQTDEYFSSLLCFEQEKADAGLLMPASSLEKVVKQCDTIVTKEALDAGNHFLQTTFEERILALCRQEKLTEAEAQTYLAENDRLLETVVQPAYTVLADGLFVLKDSSIPLTGLAAKPDGKAYYEQLLISQTGSNRPVSEIKKLLCAQFAREYDAAKRIAAANPTLLDYMDTKEYSVFPYEDAEQMLPDLQKRMKDDFPAFPEKNDAEGSAVSRNNLNKSDAAKTAALPASGSESPKQSLPSVTVKAVSPSLEPYTAPAFYLTAPLDDTDNNVIYINHKNSPSGLELYTTLAHEGYPGHLYQTVYSNRSLLQNGENNARQLLWYGGYQEGWALYVEFISFDYASALLKEHNRPLDAEGVQLEKHNRSLQLCLYSLLDIMIHYENASFSDTAKVLESFGIKNSGAAKSLYTYIAENPCNYLKYYLGYLEILSLKQEAGKLWGSGYTDLRFHTFFLDCGPSDFTSLRERLNDTGSAAPAAVAGTILLIPCAVPVSADAPYCNPIFFLSALLE